MYVRGANARGGNAAGDAKLPGRAAGGARRLACGLCVVCKMAGARAGCGETLSSFVSSISTIYQDYLGCWMYRSES